MGGAVFTAIVLIVLAAGASNESRTAVIASEAVMLDFPLTVEGLGTAHANEAVELRSSLTERIVAIRFREGQRVEAGDILVELEASQALSGVAAAKANLVASEAHFRRANELYKKKTVSGSELDQRSAQRDADKAALRAAKGRLADTVIRAPFAGRLGLRRISVGSLATPDTILTTLDDTDTIKLDFDVPEKALGLLVAGLPVQARSAAWPEEIFHGVVTVVDTRVDPVSRTVTVRAEIPNDAGHLRPGMFLSVRLLRPNTRALMVPEAAIVPEQSKQFVWVIGSDETLTKREIRTGRRRPGQVEVVSGLDPGELIIVEGTQKARPGKRVKIVDRIILGVDGSDLASAMRGDTVPVGEPVTKPTAATSPGTSSQ